MTLLQTILITVQVHLVTLLIPGADVTLVTSSGLTKSRRHALKNTLGIVLGTLVLTSVAVVVFLLAKAIDVVILNSIKVVGALFLLYMAYTTITGAFGKNISVKSASTKDSQKISPILVGFLTEVTNPEAILLFTTVFSAVSEIGGTTFHIIISGVMIIVMTAMYYSGLAFLSSSHKLAQRGRRYHKVIAIISAIIYAVVAVLIFYSILLAI